MPLPDAAEDLIDDPHPTPPRWTIELIGHSGNGWDELAGGLALRAAENGRFALISARVRGAAALSAETFQRRSTAAYHAIADCLRQCRAEHPVRMWNFIPGILAPLGSLPHRYMVFNAGRFEAFTDWYGSEGAFDRCMATASGVGHTGDDLLVHCLAADGPGRPVENPLQTSSYRYSSRYGPRPPCFARATRLSASPSRYPWLLVGGTASVHGEESLHLGDLRAQAEETFQNLAAVVGAGLHQEVPARRRSEREVTEALDRLRFLRVYYVHEEDLPAVAELIAERFPSAEDVEFLQADLCRPELLIEIEGVAELVPIDGREVDQPILAGCGPYPGARNGPENRRTAAGRRPEAVPCGCPGSGTG